jgi:hypothetical protein
MISPRRAPTTFLTPTSRARMEERAEPGHTESSFPGGLMLWNYLKVAVRNLRKHKAYSLINIAGLTVGMACFILISLWVYDETHYDSFHANSGRPNNRQNLCQPGAKRSPLGKGKTSPSPPQEVDVRFRPWTLRERTGQESRSRRPGKERGRS